MQSGVGYIEEESYLNNKKDQRLFWRNVIEQLVLFMMIGNASVTQNNNLLLMSVALVTVYCFITEEEYLFSFVVGISIYDYAFNLNGMNATLIPTGILLLRLLKKNRLILFKSKTCAICTMLILACELMGDFSYYSFGEVLLSVVNILLFLYLIANIELLHMNTFRTIVMFAVACLSAIYYMVYMYGDIGTFFNLLFTSSGLYRFGIGDANVMGGAMSLPLYALLLLSMSLSYVLVNRKTDAKKGIFLIVINAICLFFAFLTISRSLYLGLAATLLATLLGNKKYKESKIFKLFLILVIVLIGALIMYGDVIEQSIILLFNRISSDRDGAGRTVVWENCFNYMMNHPISILIGSGSCKYPTLEEGLGAGAHNLLLDITMSWGILGFVSFLFMLSYALKKIKIYCGKIESMSYIPLYAVGAFALTALRSNSLKTWSFLLVTIFVIQDLSMKVRKYRDDT